MCNTTTSLLMSLLISVFMGFCVQIFMLAYCDFQHFIFITNVLEQKSAKKLKEAIVVKLKTQ